MIESLLDSESPIQGASGSNREAESTDAPERGGLPCSSDETGVMPVERRGRVIAFEVGSTGNGRSPIFNGRRQPSRGGTSRMTRECQVRICERLGVNSPGLLGKGGGAGQGAPSVRSTSSTGNILSPPALTLCANSRQHTNSGPTELCWVCFVLSSNCCRRRTWPLGYLSQP